MLTTNDRYALNRMNSSARKYDLGDALAGTLRCVIGTYRFTRDGGAVGDITLKDENGVAVSIPSGSIVLNCFTVARTALASGGSATLDLNLNTANDLLAASAFGSHTLGAKVQGIPDFGTLADSVSLTADRNLTMSINTAALTAGALDVYVFCVLPATTSTTATVG